MSCTWLDCQAAAEHEMVSDDTVTVWANLCANHKLQFDAADGPRAILGIWVKAQGGHKAATKRMMAI